jgi:2'-5' RNA ligase
MRLFIALNFNELKDYFSELQKPIPKVDTKLTFPKDFHLTLKFLGEVEDSKVDEIKTLLAAVKFKPFEAKITSIGFFTEQFIRTVWIKAEAKEIIDLQKQVDEKLISLFKKETQFEPHITLARTKFIKDKNVFIEQIRKIKTAEKTVKIKDFELVKSTLMPGGPVYEVLGKF